MPRTPKTLRQSTFLFWRDLLSSNIKWSAIIKSLINGLRVCRRFRLRAGQQQSKCVSHKQYKTKGLSANLDPPTQLQWTREQRWESKRWSCDLNRIPHINNLSKKLFQLSCFSPAFVGSEWLEESKFVFNLYEKLRVNLVSLEPTLSTLQILKATDSQKVCPTGPAPPRGGVRP